MNDISMLTNTQRSIIPWQSDLIQRNLMKNLVEQALSKFLHYEYHFKKTAEYPLAGT